jgi:hypothetical protein
MLTIHHIVSAETVALKESSVSMQKIQKMDSKQEDVL